MANRPSHKELTKKLRQAIEALENGEMRIVDEERHFSNNLVELGTDSAKAHWAKIYDFLHEIVVSGGADCYVGAFPPYKCDNRTYSQVELFAFAWPSESMKKRMYLKFGIRLTKQNEPTYIYLNCHEDAPEKKDR